MPFLPDPLKFEQYVKKHGDEIKYQMIIEFVPRYSDAKIQEITLKNQNIEFQLQNLPKKYEIENLSHKFDHYLGTTPEEKERIAAYKREYEKLIKEFQKLPDINTDQWSIFFSDNVALGFDLWPEDTSEDVYSLKDTLKNILQKTEFSLNDSSKNFL